MKRILLINPWIHDFAAYDLWLRPLGLLYIASFLQQKGWFIDFLDCLDRFHPLLLRNGMVPTNRGHGTGKFASVELPKPDAIASIPRRFKRFGIPYALVEDFLLSLKDVGMVLVTSSMTYWYGGVKEMVDLVRPIFPGARILLGGTYASLMRTHAETEIGADRVIPGMDFFPILGELGEEEESFNLEGFFNTVSPAYHLYESLPHVALITSLGCPFSCSYCASRKIAPAYLALSHEKILADIEEYALRFKVQDIALYDDALLYNAGEHFLPLFEKVVRKEYHMRFHTPNGLHARFITGEVAHVLKKSGFKTIRIGLESSSNRFQENTGKKVTSEEVAAAVHHLKTAGFKSDEIGIYLMAGREDEQVDDVLKTLAFVEQLGTKAFVSEYSPVPGSLDWDGESGLAREDPLWQNNSFAFLKHGWTLDQMQRIKDMKNHINQSTIKT